MKQNDIVVVLAAFAAYLILMVVVGAVYMKKTKNSEDYFLGGRGLSGWVAALSAQASDMSGWLLMGLPGTVYALGTGQAWIAVGLFLGTVFNWVCISSRLRRYTIVANNSLTLPAYFENRFRDKKRVLLLVSSIVIVVFFLVYTASALSAGGKLFHSVFGIDYHIALAIGAVVILAYTFMGGFMAVCVTDFIQGSLMLVGLLAVPVLAYCFIGSGNLNAMLDESQVIGGHQAYLSMTRNGESSYSFIEIFSQLAWGLGYCGMPHILTRFMAVKNQKELKKSRVIAIIWVALSLFAAVAIGVLGRAYLYPVILGTEGQASTESVFIENFHDVTEKLRLLREYGIKVSLDDFGTGYSNFHCIRDMNPSYVKMDKDFTAKAMSCERDYELFKKIIEMVHSIGIRICVEGIEKEDWHLKMKELQADYLQGYFFGKPCEKKKFMEEFVCNPHNNGVW